MPILAVIGAGPKGIAIAAKARALTASVSFTTARGASDPPRPIVI